MINSMTGFGAADGMVGRTRVGVEVRSVNHRFFTPTIKLPAGFSKWEPEMRDILRKRVLRGHITLFARTGSDSSSDESLIDDARLAQYLNAIRDIKTRHQIPGELDIATVLRLPNLFGQSWEDADTGSVDELAAIVSKAVSDLLRMRQSEGAHLGRYLEERLADVTVMLSRIRDRAPSRLIEQNVRVRATVGQLLEDLPLDDARVAQEVAILAEKLDVAEEIERFNAHLAAFGETIRATGGEPVGKRLGFLLQEMVRETNTLGSKANDSAILADVILIKEELERMREQVENVE